MEKPNWPIRPGGIYNSKRRNDVAFRVVAVHGGSIDVMHRMRSMGDREHSPVTVCDTYFREECHDEDQSPLPAFHSLAERLIEMAEKGTLATSGRFLAHEARLLLAGEKVQPETEVVA